MSDDIFDLDEFVSPAPVAKTFQPAEYDHNEFTFEPVAAVEAIGAPGEHGKDGLEGKAGIDGLQGSQGSQGLDGAPGSDGADGVSVVDTFVRDDDLFLRLSDGKLINAGNVRGPQGFQGPQGSGGGRGYRGGGVKKDMGFARSRADSDARPAPSRARLSATSASGAIDRSKRMRGLSTMRDAPVPDVLPTK